MLLARKRIAFERQKLSFCFFVEILPFSARSPTIFNGACRTVVIAGETSQTTVGMPPLGQLARLVFDIVHRTHLRTLATAQASLGRNAERFVGDEMPEEETAQQAGVQSGPLALGEHPRALVPFYIYKELLQSLGGCLFFHAFTLGRVNIHERQSDIRLGHDERPGGTEFQLMGLKVGSEQAHGLADIIAGSAERPDIRRLLKHKMGAVKPLPEQQRRPPSMHGETKSQALTLGKTQRRRRRVAAGYINKRLAEHFCCPASRP